MLRLDKIERNFSHFALGEINMEIPEGYIVGILGENGAGKSTLLKLMLGYLKPDGGSLFMDDISMWAMPEGEKSVKNQMGFVLNEDVFSPYRSLRENGKRYGRYYTDFGRQEFLKYLEEFNLEPDRRYGKLSRGEKLKFQFAFALSHCPRLLLLDEPLGSFDTEFRESFLTLLTDFVSDGRHSVVMASHLTEELDRIADYVALLFEGKLIEYLDIEELREKYRLLSGERYKLDLLKKDWIVYREDGVYASRVMVRHNAFRKYDRALTVEVPTLEDIFYYRIRQEKSQVFQGRAGERGGGRQ